MRNIAPIKLGPVICKVRRTGGAPRIEHRPFQVRSCVSHPSPTAPRFFFGDRRHGRSVENARPLYLFRAADVRPLGILAVNIAPINASSDIETDPPAIMEFGPLWINGTTPSTALADGSFPVARDAACGALFELGLQSSHDGQPVGRNIAPIKLGPEVADVGEPSEGHGSNIALFKSRSCVSHPSPTAPRFFRGDRHRGRSVENARRPVLFSGAGRHSDSAGQRLPEGTSPISIRPRKVRRTASILLTYTVVRRTLSRVRSTDR